MRSGVGGSVILQAQLAQDFVVGAFTAGESLALAYPMRVTVRGLGPCKRPGFHTSHLGLQTYTEWMMGEGLCLRHRDDRSSFTYTYSSGGGSKNGGFNR
jgi:hypothetical protein